MNINIENVPFSYPGSYIAVQKENPLFGDGIWIRSLIRPEWGTGRKKASDKLLRIIPTDARGVFIRYKTVCTADSLRFESNFGYVELFFSAYDVITVKAKDMGLVFEHSHEDAKFVNVKSVGNLFTAYVPVTYHNVEIAVSKGEMKYVPSLRRCFLTCNGDSAQCTVTVWQSMVEKTPCRTPVFTKEETKESFAAFKAHYAPSNDVHELATYILWSARMRALGNITRDVTAVSKDIMDNVWSWDNCFNSYALRKADPQLSLNNVMLFFDLQKSDGGLLDAVNPFIKVDWFTKPPVYGFFVYRLMRCGIIEGKTIEELMPKMEKLAARWERNTGNTGLFYYEDPFDSGWDNATCFDNGMPMYSPDLNAYMVWMYVCISDMAKRVGDDAKAEKYDKKAHVLLDTMVEKMFDGKQFLCLDAEEKSFETTSLIKMVPIMLGRMLPDEVFKNLAEEISREQHFLVEASLASEAVDSPYYDNRKCDAGKPNAYWRGPVWAPPVYFIHEGLFDAEYYKLATKIATRYIGLIENGKDGIYENYDAILQTGYDDSALMWTVSVYLLLKERYDKNN